MSGWDPFTWADEPAELPGEEPCDDDRRGWAAEPARDWEEGQS